MVDVMLLALRKFNADILQQVFKEPGKANVIIRNEFIAMHIYGKQVQVPDVTHYQMALTQVAVQDSREMPFVTWGKTAYMFTMRLDSRGQVHGRPTRLMYTRHAHVLRQSCCLICGAAVERAVFGNNVIPRPLPLSPLSQVGPCGKVTWSLST